MHLLVARALLEDGTDWEANGGGGGGGVGAHSRSMPHHAIMMAFLLRCIILLHITPKQKWTKACTRTSNLDPSHENWKTAHRPYGASIACGYTIFWSRETNIFMNKGSVPTDSNPEKGTTESILCVYICCFTRKILSQIVQLLLYGFQRYHT